MVNPHQLRIPCNHQQRKEPITDLRGPAPGFLLRIESDTLAPASQDTSTHTRMAISSRDCLLSPLHRVLARPR